MDKLITKEPGPFYGEKPNHRKHMQELSYADKVRIVVELQKRIAPILKARGENVSPWTCDL